MRVLTVRQPWAWAIMHAGKTVENRTRNLAGSYRGPVAIHAGLSTDEGAFDHDLIKAAFGKHSDSWWLEEQVGISGAILGVVDLVSVHHDSDHGRNERDRCSWWAETGTWHLMLRKPRPFVQPIPAKGKLGLWRPGAELHDQIIAAGVIDP